MREKCRKDGHEEKKERKAGNVTTRSTITKKLSWRIMVKITPGFRFIGKVGQSNGSNGFSNLWSTLNL